MRYYLWSVFAIAVTLTLHSCGTEETTTTTQSVQGIDLSLMDTTISPGADFYKFANGNWLKNTEIPADQGRWASFSELRKKTDANVLEVLTGSMEGDAYQPGSDQAKAATFYQTAMDTAQINRIGLTPVEPVLGKVNAISNVSTLQQFLTESASLRHGALWQLGVIPDPNNSEVNAAYLSAGALGLPDRDYYIKEDDESKRLQQAYKDHVTRMLGFLDYSPEEAQSTAEKIYNFEKRMAGAMLTNVQRRNPLLMNNPRSVADLQKMVPSINWKQYLEGIGASQVDTLIIPELKYMAALEAILQDEPIDNVKEYLKWTQLNRASSFLSSDIEQANFDFYGKVLRGTAEMRPRNERVLSTANGVIGEAIGKLYVDAYFPPEAKATAEEMVDNLLVAMGDRIKALPWMSDATKEKALEKLSTFTVKIAYPDEWKDYSELMVKSAEEGGSYVENMMNASAWSWNQDLEKIGQPVDKKEWGMAPQIVNAYYNPFFNEIVFPAAILQPPFFNFEADAAVNFGGMGAVIGHEISHGFDDQGSRFDAEGNLKNWWTEEDRQRFEERTAKLVAQFDAYEPLEGVNVNGSLTLGENIGDLGGISIAFDGLQQHLAEKGDPGLINGLTPSQRFFISWATIWRTKYRDESLKTQINTDPHSPGMYRAVGPLVNFDPFYKAFSIQESDPIFVASEERVRIW